MPKKEGGKDKTMLKKIFVILGLACIVSSSFGLASATITNEGFDYIAGHMAGYGINSYAPMWSPNSTQIAYIQDDTERADVWVMDADGTNKTQLTTYVDLKVTDPDIKVTGIEWSPDGTQIAYIIHDPTGRSGYSNTIGVMDSDGSNKTRLTTARCSYYPAWSPDGTQIAYSIRNPAGGQEHSNTIWVIDADGSNKTQLTYGWNIYKPLWSPDGMRIAYVSYATANPNIRIMDSNGGNTRQLDRPRLTSIDYRYDEDPNWSPDSTKILFLSQRDRPGNWDIWVVTSYLNNPKSLTEQTRAHETRLYTDVSAYSYTNPTWSPNGTEIAFTSGSSGAGTRVISVMDADGSNKVQLYPEERTTLFKGYFSDLGWSPDGSKLIFSVEKDHHNSIGILTLGESIIPTATPSAIPTPVSSPTPATPLLTQELGHLDVATTPAGAELYFDGDYKGVSPISIANVSAGNHSLRLTMTGYENWTATKVVKANETSSVSATLSEIQTATFTPSVPAETPSPPGYEAIVAIAGLLTVAYLLRRHKGA